MKKSFKKYLSLVMVLMVAFVCLFGVSVKAASEPVATFELGANGSASHNDGTDAGTTKSYTEESYTLNLTGMSKVYAGARDAKGNSCLKLGTSSVVGTFTFTVPIEVVEVKIYAAKYKSNTTKVSVNGTAYTLTKNSNDGAYDEIIVDTTSNKNVTFTTVAGGARCMVNTIVFCADNVQSVTPTQKFEGVETNASLLANYVKSGTELYDYELTQEIFSTEEEVATVNGVTWTGATAEHYGYDNTYGRGMQISKKNLEMPLYTITSSESFENVKYVKINASGASDTDATITVTIGGKQIGDTVKLTTSATDYEFVSVEALSGVMVITYEQTSQRAVFFKSVQVMDEVPSYSMETASLRFGVASMNADLYDDLVAAGSEVSFGVAYIKANVLGANTFEEAIADDLVTYRECTPVLNGETYQFALVLTGIPAVDFDEEVTAAAYVCVDGDYYYAIEKTYSVNTIATEYVTNQASNAAVKEHLGMLNWLQTYIGE